MGHQSYLKSEKFSKSFWKKQMKIIIKKYLFGIKDLWGTKVMFCYVVK